MKREYQNGFTLMEVLIALAIIAIALTAIVMATSRDIEDTARIEHIAFAEKIAFQIIQRAQLNLIPVTESQSGSRMAFNKTWYWQLTPQNTANPHVRKLTVAVRSKPQGDILTTLHGYTYIQRTP